MSNLLLGLDPERTEATARKIRETLGADAVEVLARTSRARVVTFELERSGHLAIESQGSQEAGHTVRFTADERWGAWSATDGPRPPEQAPPTARGRLALPTEARVRSLRDESASADRRARSRVLERPLLGESDARRWIDRLVDAATSALANDAGPGPAFHLRGRLEDGAAESLLVNTHGVVAPDRSRVTGVRLEMILGSQGASVYMAANEDLISTSTEALSRLVAELELRRGAKPLEATETGTVLLRPAVLAPILARLGGRCWQPGGVGDLAAPEESTGFSLWDRPDLAAGFLGGERDGEGLYASRCLLGDHDGFRPVLPWERLDEGDSRVGFRWRASWRDLPRFGPSHLQMQGPPGLEPEDDSAAPAEHDLEVVAIRGGIRVDGAGLSMEVLGHRVHSGERSEPLRANLRLPEADLLSHLVSGQGELETHTLPTCSVTCPGAVFQGLRLDPLPSRSS